MSRTFKDRKGERVMVERRDGARTYRAVFVRERDGAWAGSMLSCEDYASAVESALQARRLGERVLIENGVGDVVGELPASARVMR